MDKTWSGKDKHIRDMNCFFFDPDPSERHWFCNVTQEDSILAGSKKCKSLVSTVLSLCAFQDLTHPALT